MDTAHLAQDFIANCLAPAAADEGTHESTDHLDDGRVVIAAACPPTGSAAFAVELNLHGIERDVDGELELGLLEAVWNHRLGDGLIAAREADGKDVVALVAHRSTAAPHALAASMGHLLEVAANPLAPVEGGGEQPSGSHAWVPV